MGLWLPPQAPQAPPQAPATLIPEGMTLVTHATFVFNDPKWGPITFRLYVYRHEDNDLPEYEVVVE